MKKIITSVIIGLSSFASLAQVGAVAPNIVADDINGTTHDVYAHLAAGKVVIVDMFATWCSPCWGFHNAHYLEDLNAQFGPNGTDEVVIIAYEDASNTNLDDVYGTGSNTLGNWTTGITYNMIHGPVVLPAEYGSGYPTISVICPSDKKIKYNLFNSGGSLQQMVSEVQTVIDDCGTASIDDVSSTISLSIAPNPTAGVTNVVFDAAAAQNADVSIYSLSGELVSVTNHKIIEGKNSIALDLNAIEAGMYLLKVETDNSSSTMTSIVKM